MDCWGFSVCMNYHERQYATSGIISARASRHKDSEIIKFSSSKPYDMAHKSESIKILNSALPTNMYPEINLKRLLTKTEGIPKHDDLKIKSV